VRQFSVGPLNVTGFRLAHYIHRMMQPRMFSISQPWLNESISETFQLDSMEANIGTEH